MKQFISLLPINIFAFFEFLIALPQAIKISIENDEVKYIKVVCKDNCLLLKISSFLTKASIAGLTAGSFVFIKESFKDNQKILKHEQVHIKQEIKWSILFPFIYLYYYAKINITKSGDPYKDNPFEKEAYEYGKVAPTKKS